MSDEQTGILQQILEVQKEQLTFFKQQREELTTLQRTTIEQQTKDLRLNRLAMVFLLVASVCVAIWVAWVARWIANEQDADAAKQRRPAVRQDK